MIQRLKSQKLKSQILLGYSLPILLLVVSACLVFLNVQEVTRRSKKVMTSNNQLETIRILDTAFSDLQKEARGYLFRKERRFLDNYREELTEVKDLTEKLQETATDEKQLDLIRQITDLTETIEQNQNQLFVLNDREEFGQVFQYWDQQVLPLLEQNQGLITDFVTYEKSKLEENQQIETQALERLLLVVIISTILAAILAIALGIWIASAIAEKLTNAANAIASSSTQMSATVEEQERIANQQAAAVSETTTTIDQLGVSSEQSALQVQNVASNASQVATLAELGGHAVQRSLQGILSMKQQVKNIAQEISQLNEQTQQIGNISQLVSDLANQTNMLALNAAVEAVRAGENGKGFSVVASEIRKLADESRKSAEKINLLVSDIQKSITSTVTVTDQGTKTVDESVMVTEETTETFSSVAKAIDDIVISTQQISINAKQQAQAIQQIVEAMNSINQGVSQTATGISQTKVGVHDLNAVALNLQEMV